MLGSGGTPARYVVDWSSSEVDQQQTVPHLALCSALAGLGLVRLLSVNRTIKHNNTAISYHLPSL